MKKIFMLIFMFILGIIFIPNGVFAATLDKTSIENALKSIQAKDTDLVYKVNDDNFVITDDGVDYTVKFVVNSSTASSNPNTSIFTMTSVIDNTVTYEQYKNLIENSAIYYGFFVDAINQGQTYEDSSSYLVSKILEQLSNASGTIDLTNSYIITGEGVTCENTDKCISESEFSSRAVEYADNTLSDYSYSDNLFTISTSKVKDDTAGNLTYTTTLKVKDDGDFTVIKGSYDSLSKTFDDLTSAIESSIESNNPKPVTSQQVSVPDTGVIFPISVKILGLFALVFGILSILFGVFFNKKQNQV